MMVERARRFVDNGLLPNIPLEFPSQSRLLFKNFQGIPAFQSYCSQMDSIHVTETEAALRGKLRQTSAEFKRYLNSTQSPAAFANIFRDAIFLTIAEFDYCRNQVGVCDLPNANEVANWNLITARVKSNFKKADRHARRCASDLLAMFKTVV